MTVIAQYALDHATALSGSDLRERFSASALGRAVASGDIVRVLPDVYASAAHASAFDVRAQAASLWARAPVTGLAALYLWGLIDAPPTTIEVLVGSDRKLRDQPWVKVRRVGADIPQSIRGGVPTVSPAAAVVMAYGLLPAARRAGVVYGAIGRRLVGVWQLRAMVEAIPRIRARAALERTISAAEAGARSWLEERALYRVFNTKEFSRLVAQHEVVIEGNQFVLDLFDPLTKTAVELDGREGHTDAGRQRNIARDCWVATLGILTLRFSYGDLVHRPQWCRWVVREVLALRAGMVGTGMVSR